MILSDVIFVIIVLGISASMLIYANYDMWKQVKKDIETEKERVVILDNEELIKRAKELKLEIKYKEEE